MFGVTFALRRIGMFAGSAAVVAAFCALFAVPANEAQAHSTVTVTTHASLPFAARDGEWDTVNHFIDQHITERDVSALNVQSPTGETALNFAANRGHISIALTLIALGVDVNLPNGQNLTPLHGAALYNSIPLAEALISAGASLNVKHRETGRTPLAYAGINEKKAILPVLISAGGHWGEPCAEGYIASTVPNAAGRYPYPPDPLCIPNPEAKCEDGYFREDGNEVCVADPDLIAANAMLRAAIGEDEPDIAAIRALLMTTRASLNITTSAGIPILADAALNLHAELVSVLITAGADPYARVPGIYHAGYNSQTLPAFIPGALAERAFHDRSKSDGEFTVGERWAETIIHFGDAAGNNFSWGRVDRTRDNGGVTYPYTAGELALGYMQITRALVNTLTKDQLLFLDAIGRYIRARGESCVDKWYGTGVNGEPSSICADTRICASKETYSCSRDCAGSPLIARNPTDIASGQGTCISECGENQHAVATPSWPPESRCECEHKGELDAGKCPGLPAEQDLLDEMRKDSPNIATIRALLSDGASANLTLEDGRPLIFVAVSLRRADIVSVLVTAGARPDVRHNFGETGSPENFYVPGRIIWGAHAQLARPDGLTRYTKGETATLMIHFAEAVKIAATASNVSFPWGVPARVNNSFYYLGQARVAVAVKNEDPEIKAEIEDELSFIGGYLLDQGASCDDNLTAGTAAHTALCLSRRSCALSGSSVTVVSSCGACAGSPLRTPAGDSCAAACGHNQREKAAPSSWGERQCEFLPAVAAANMTLLAEIQGDSPDLDVVRAALRAGAVPDHRTAEGIPALIVAAKLGRAEVVSVLVTAGADVNATDPTHPDRLNVVHHLATPLSGPAAGPRALRASVLYYFGGGLDVAGNTTFDWNQENRSGYRALDLLASATTAENQALAGESPAVTYEMATYLLRRGAQCGDRTADHSHQVCTGLMARVIYAESPRAGGTLTASVPSGGTTLRGSAVTFTAAPAAGWTLTAWAGDDENCAASDLQCVLTADADLHVTATFAYVGDCDVGERGVWVGNQGQCFSAADADEVDACAAAGWEVNTRSDSEATYWICAVPAARLWIHPTTGAVMSRFLPGTDGRRPSGCGIGDRFARLPCAEVFDNPPQFPEKPTPPDEISGIGYYVSNCSYDGELPAIPANVNTIGATNCLCAEVDGHTGVWPKCCPDGQEAKDGACVALPTFAVEYKGTPDGGGIVTASIPSGGTTLQGATATFTATPAAGWYVAGWNRADCVNIGAAATPGEEKECVLTADADLFVTAAFAEARAVVYGANISASLAVGGGNVNIGDTVADGVTIAFLAAPPENQEVAWWTNNGATVCVGENPCLLEVSGDLNVLADFASLLRTITYAEETPPGRSGGTLTASIPSGGTALRGATVTFTATPAAGWYVEEWTGDGAGCAPSARECEARVDGDLFVTVRFAETQVVAALSYEARPAAGGTVTVAGLIGDTVVGGSTVTFLATPATGWYVAGWNRGDCANIGAAATPGEEKECILTADGDLSVRADFAEARTVFYEADISASLADGGGDVNSGDTVADGVTIAFLATPPENQMLAWWTKNGATVCVGENPCLLAADGGLSVRAAFAPIMRMIAYAKIPDGQRGGTVTASVPSGGTAPHGATATFTATPAAGWYVAGWNYDDCANVGAAATPGVKQECALTVDADLFVTATFAEAWPVVYEENISARLADGGGRVNSEDTFADGVTIAFSATPPANHRLAWWMNNGVAVCDGENPCLLAVDGGLSVRAGFARIVRTIAYAEIPDDQSGGIVTSPITSGGTALQGDEARFTATPEAGWYVAGWNRGDCVKVGAAATPGFVQECVLTVDADLFVTATFAEARAVVYEENISASLAVGGERVNSGDTVADGTMIEFLATPPENHEFAGWTNNGVTVCFGQNPCLLEVSGDLNVQAKFDSLLRTITYAEETLGTTRRGGDLTASVPSGGTALLGTTVTFTATPALRYYVEEWTGDGAGCAKFDRICEAVVDADLFVTVRFAETQILSALNYAALPTGGAGGTLTVDANFHAGEINRVLGGALVTFRATPAAGWVVAAWEGDVGGCAAPDMECALRANRDLFVTVHFAMTARVEHMVFPEDGRGGTLTIAGLAGEDFAYAGATLTVRALPATRWVVAAWEGDVGSCAAPDLECALTVAGDLSVTVRYAEENCRAKNRQPGGSPSVNGLAPDGCGACMDGYGRFGKTGDLCAAKETGDFGGIAEDVVCEELRGDLEPEGEGVKTVCSGVDSNDTFCILNSAEGLPCRGLLRHVLRCNVGFERPALNPFFCGARCGEMEAIGAKCR